MGGSVHVRFINLRSVCDTQQAPTKTARINEAILRGKKKS